MKTNLNSCEFVCICPEKCCDMWWKYIYIYIQLENCAGISMHFSHSPRPPHEMQPIHTNSFQPISPNHSKSHTLHLDRNLPIESIFFFHMMNKSKSFHQNGKLKKNFVPKHNIIHSHNRLLNELIKLYFRQIFSLEN